MIEKQDAKMQAIRLVESLDMNDTREIFIEMVMNYGDEPILEWLNELADLDGEGNKVRIIDDVGHVVG